jgi:dipeptidyl-peptidase-4
VAAPAGAAGSAALPADAAGGLKQITLDAILGEKPFVPPLLPGVRFSPDGERLTYLAPEKGEDGPNAIWALTIKSGERAIIVPADALPLPSPAGGEPAQSQPAPTPPRLGSYQWSPKGDAVLISSAGDLFSYSLADRTARRLTSTAEDETNPQISPDGAWVAYVRGHNLFAVPMGGGAEVALTSDGSEVVLMGEPDWVSCEELELCSAFWWSPDSRRIAFLKFDQEPVYRHPLVDWLPVHAEMSWERYPKAGDPNARLALGVVAIADRGIRWLETGAGPEDYLPRVAWDHEGTTLLVQRLNRGQDRLELVRIDAAGAAPPRTLLTEEDPHWVNLAAGPELLDDGRMIWSSERDGWRHLYLYDAGGKLLRRLTQGAWLVESVEHVDQKAGIVYFTATEKGVLERHLYRVGLDGKGFSRVAQEEGTHATTVDPTGKHYVDRYSQWGTPTALALHRIDGSRVEDLSPAVHGALSGFAWPRHEFLRIPATDGETLQGELLTPSDFDPARRYPVLVYVYGGPGVQIVRDTWGGWRTLFHAMLAERGYLVFSVDGRGSSGRGHAWETAIDRRMGKRELEDQLAGVRYLKSLPYVDPGRIGIWGWSYGGTMTLYALTNAPGVFRVGVSGAPVTDWRLYDTIYTERYLERPQDNPDGYRDSSPVSQAARLQGKLLLVHGTGDDNVHLQNSLTMVQAFIEANVPYDLEIYPRQLHGFQDRKARLSVHERILRFLLDNL